VYSVSPQRAAHQFVEDGSKAQDAASALKITAQDMKELGIIDKIIKEPHGGAHRDTKRTIESVRVAISESLNELNKIDKGRLQEMRKEKFLAMGKKGL
jgi:Acetyl-CoA carboxylase alpha subunit